MHVGGTSCVLFVLYALQTTCQSSNEENLCVLDIQHVMCRKHSCFDLAVSVGSAV